MKKIGIAIVVIVIMGWLILWTFPSKSEQKLGTYRYPITDHVSYTDRTVTFKGFMDEVTFGSDELAQLEQILFKADKIDKESKKNVKVNVEYPIGKINNHEFTYLYEYKSRHSSYSTKTSYLIITTPTQYGVKNSVLIGSYSGKYSFYMQEYRDDYLRQVREVDEAKAKFDKILNEK